MALTGGDLAYLRSELGDSIDEIDLEERHDRLGSVPAVASEVLRQRLATMLSGPSSFSIPGVYTESNDATIKALQQQIARLAEAPAPVVAGGGSGRLVRPDRVR